jgi:hypothetical protein
VVAASHETDLAGGAPRSTGTGWAERLRWDWVSSALTLIVLGGAAARLAGGSWGLPLDLHPDEWVVVHGAIEMAQHRSFEPPYFFRPDHVEMELSNLAYLAYSYLFHGASPEKVFGSDPAPFVVISRAITACFGVAMIVLAYLIGTRFARGVGVMAAFVVAFFPPFVDNSHFATPDVPLSLAFMIVILGCMRYLSSPSWGNLALASLGVSVAIAIKYPGALGALMIAITVIVGGVRARAWSRILVHGAGALLAVIGFLFAISPVLFTNMHAVILNLTAEAGTTHLGADGLGWGGNMAYYVGVFASSAGIILLVCFVLGVAWSIHLRLVQSIPLWCGVLVWLILSGVPLHWDRWGLPMFLTPLLMAPIGAYYSFRYLRDNRAARWQLWGAAGLGAVLAVNLTAGSAAVVASFMSTNTQTLASELAGRGIDSSNAIYEGYTPLLPGLSQVIFNKFDVVHGRLVLRGGNPTTSAMRYLVLSSDMDDRYRADPRYGTQQRFYSMVYQQFPLLVTYASSALRKPSVFEPVSIWNALGYAADLAHGGLVGPTIKVYQIPAAQR